MGVLKRLRLRLRRRRLQLRALRKLAELSVRQDRTADTSPEDILLFATVRNEADRLPYFFDYYRRLGVDRFFFVDNGSDDGTREWLEAQPDTSVWTTTASYKRARFGCDWINGLLARHGRGHWVLVVDVDEFLVYPHSDVRPLRALTEWLDASAVKSFAAMLVDMYSTRPIEEARYTPGQNPFEVLDHFDSGNYSIKRDWTHDGLWIQGGPRMRVLFDESPDQAPALNKIPLVKWSRGTVYLSSTHSLLPRGLNRVYDEWGGEKPSGCLLHAKFLNLLTDKAEEEMLRRQHYAGSREYIAYRARLGQGRSLQNEWSVRYRGWRQLEQLGLMSSGGWI
ncbi:MAG: glycosyltransferase family 2 protein [Pseudomonadota bacterium]